MDDEIPMDDIDAFHEQRDKIYLDEYKNSQRKEPRKKEFLPLTRGKAWSDDSSDEDDGLLTKHQRDIIKLDKLNKFKESMGSDFEDDDDDDDAEEEEDFDDPDDEISKIDKKSVKEEKSNKKSLESTSRSLNWGGRRKQYYGGEGDVDMEQDDDEDQINDFKRLHSLFHASVNLEDSRVQLLSPQPHDLVFAAGASRFHLITATLSQPSSDTSGIKSRREEWEIYLDHSLPVFVKPDPEIEENPDKMKQYVKTEYPDMDDYYRGYVRVEQWMDRVWQPLHSNYLDNQRIKMDSIAGQYIAERKTRLEAEKFGLGVYYRMRLESYAMLRYNSIHKDLKELKEERESYRKKDHNFMLLAGNILLKSMHTNLSFREMAKSIPGEEEFLRCLHSPEEDKQFQKVNKCELIQHQSQFPSSTKISLSDDSEEEMMHYSDENGEEEEERRPITYQMSKNKGFMVKRKKRDRNPRVKLRNKFKKALIRRKSQVPNVRREEKRYGGEVFGIRSGLIKSRKFKV